MDTNDKYRAAFEEAERKIRAHAYRRGETANDAYHRAYEKMSQAAVAFVQAIDAMDALPDPDELSDDPDDIHANAMWDFCCADFRHVRWLVERTVHDWDGHIGGEDERRRTSG